MLGKLKNSVLDSQVKKSIFRVGIPNTDRKRVLIVLGNVFLHLHPTKVRTSGVKLRYTWCAGGLAFFLFLVLTLTGVLLMFYYRPTVEGAYVDMLDIRSQVPFGIMRELHRWSAHAMVIMVMIHMFRVFMTGSYKPPREFNWVIGVILLVLTFLLSFTGYLLPWDQLAIWAITVGSNMAKATPLVGAGGPFADFLQIGGVPLIHPGDDARFMLIGAKELGGTTLLRFYVLHCVGIPLGAAVLMAVHFWRIRKDGGISGPLQAMEHAALFGTFKSVANALANPWLSFSLVAFGLLLLLRFRRYVFNWWIGALLILLEAVVVLVGMKDPNFYKIVGKPDNVPITIMFFLSTFTLWLAMVQAVNNDRRAAQKLPPEEKEASQQKTWVWPDLLYIEFIALIICSVLLILWAIYLRAPLEEPANPSATPNPSKAPWYFLGLQEMLVYYDPWYAGVVLPTIIIIGLMAIPYIDINPKGNGYFTFTERKMAITTFLFGYLALWVFMIITGTFLRGPGWNFFGPFEYWDPHKVVALNNVNLSDYVWIVWLKKGLPEVKNVVPQLLPPDMNSIKAFLVEVGHAGKKEFAGLLFLGFYFLALPGVMAKTFLRKFYEQMDLARYSMLAMLVLTMGTLPLKMVLRWTINLKYFVDTPWIKF